MTESSFFPRPSNRRCANIRAMTTALRIFVVADTHDKLPANLESFAAGADEIWHLGDVCAPSILETIEALGPRVTVVRGNCDGFPEWPLKVDLQRNGVRFRLVHIPPDEIPDDVDVVLHGHTHVPRNEVVKGVRFLNPGCVTRPNRGAPPSVAVLEVTADGKLTWRLKSLR
jgi:putative phosphoesterase